MIALDVVLGCQVMMLGCCFVVLCGFVVGFACHFDCPVGKSPGAILTRPPVKSSSPVAEDSHG